MSECEDVNEHQYFILVGRIGHGDWDLVTGDLFREELAQIETTLTEIYPDHEYRIIRATDDKVAIKMALRLMNWNRDLI